MTTFKVGDTVRLNDTNLLAEVIATSDEESTLSEDMVFLKILETNAEVLRSEFPVDGILNIPVYIVEFEEHLSKETTQ
jgi:hypothetical protein